jgi:hypothetical protein
MEIHIPVKSLAIRDWSDAPATPSKGKNEPREILPQAGDPVEFRAKGTVSEIDGDTAIVHVAFINDKRPAAGDGPAKKEKESPRDKMLAMAKEADGEEEGEEAAE